MSTAISISSILKNYWGHDSFRPQQEEIINSVMQGKDTLALLPTGGGKSVCFQVPALAMDGLCLVVSPLIALMKDQVHNLKQKNIAAEAIFSGMNNKEIDRILDNCIYGNIKFLYVSPERLTTELFLIRLQKMKVNLIAVDEAHCISQWGYDFRPPYLKIAAIRVYFPHIPVLALTATATEAVRVDIIKHLEFKNYQVFINSFERKNLAYVVQKENDKLKKLLTILQKVPGCAVVYVRNRKQTKEIANWLVLQKISADFYHAGLNFNERNKKQDAWIKNKTRVIVATNAFGMGIDKPDVRVVVHVDLPDSLEAYYQEAGRGGRDGLKSFAVLVYNDDDIKLIDFKVENFFPPVEKIKLVYDAVCQYLQLPVGSGGERSFDFDINDFSNRFNIHANTIYQSLKILEQNNYITPTDSVYNLSKIMFVVGKDVLYSFEIENKKMEPLIKAVMRMYGGVSEHYTEISEKELALYLKISVAELVQQFQYLVQANIMDYFPAKTLPQLYFNQPRAKTEDVWLDVQQLIRLKENYETRMAAVSNYVLQCTECRSKILLFYFDEQIENACGHCDFCLGLKKYQIDDSILQTVLTKLKSIEITNGISKKEIEILFPKLKEEQLTNTLAWMLEENVVEKSAGVFWLK